MERERKQQQAVADAIADSKNRSLQDGQIPADPEAFYEDFGYIRHPETGKPITKLASYQISAWQDIRRYKYNLFIKSQKIGFSTAMLLADFQMAILPPDDPLSCRGKEILLIAQSIPHARMHLATLRRLILNSKKYKHYLITTSKSFLLRDEITKVTKLLIHNDTNPLEPTEIIGLGPKEGGIWSWTKVKYIHASDVAASNQDYSAGLNIALTRLANTRGRMTIESPPRGPYGKLYEIYVKSREKTDLNNPAGKFHVKQLPVDLAIAEGVVSKEQIEEYKAMFGREYPALFEAEFIAVGGNLFDIKDVERCEVLGRKVDWLNPNIMAEKSMGVDPGFGSSNTGIVVTQAANGQVEVIYAQEFKNSTHTRMLQHCWELGSRYGVKKIFVDASTTSFVRDLKAMFGEREDFEEQMKTAKRMKLPYSRFMKVVPTSFAKHGDEMLSGLCKLVEAGKLAIPERIMGSEVLMQQMRSAIVIAGSLDKSKSELDCLDALRLATTFYNVRRPGEPLMTS